MRVIPKNTVTSIERIERFENAVPKQQANAAARKNFPDLGEGIVVGLLGISDVKFYLTEGYEQDQIHTVEHIEWPNFVSLRNDLQRANLGQVKVKHADVFEYIAQLPDRSISALFLDLWGFSDLCSNARGRRRNENLELICMKLADEFHMMVTYEDQRSKSIWMKTAKEALIDEDRSRYLMSACAKFLKGRDVEVGSLLSHSYKGLLSDGRTCKMVTTSFVGTSSA